MSRRKTLLLGAGAALLPLAGVFPRRAGAAEFPGVAEALPNPAYPNGGNIRPLPQDGVYPVTWWGARADNGATDNAAAFEGFSDFLRLSRDAPGYIPGSDGAYGVSRPFPIYSGTSWIGDGPARSRIINSTRNKGQFWSNGVAYLGTFFARGPTKIGPQSPFDMIPVAGQALYEPGSTSITALGGIWQVGDVVLIEDIARRGKTRYANYAGLNSVVRVDGLRLELKYPVDVAMPQGAKLYRMPRDPADSFASFLAVNPHWKGRPSFLTQGASMKGLFLGQIDGPTAEAPAQTLHVACYECTLEDVAVEGSFTAIGGNPFARNIVRGCSFTSQWRAAELAYVTGHNTLIDTRCTVVDGRMSGDRGSGFTLRLSSEDMFGNNLVQGGVLEWRRTDEGGKSPAVDLHGDGDRMENVQVIAGVKPLAIGLVGDGGVIRNCTISGGTALAISSTRGDPVIEGNRISPEARRVASIRMRDRGGRIQSNVLGDGSHPSHVIDVENFDAFDSGALDVSGNEGGYYSNLRSGSSLTETVQGTRIVAQATSPGERLNRRSRASGTIAFSCDAGQASGEKQFFVRINGADSAPVTLPAGQTGSFTFRMTTSEVAVDSIRVDLAIDGAGASRSDTLQVRTRGGPVTVELGIAMSGGALTLSRREVGFVSPQLHLRSRPKKG